MVFSESATVTQKTQSKNHSWSLCFCGVPCVLALGFLSTTKYTKHTKAELIAIQENWCNGHCSASFCLVVPGYQLSIYLIVVNEALKVFRVFRVFRVFSGDRWWRGRPCQRSACVIATAQAARCRGFRIPSVLLRRAFLSVLTLGCWAAYPILNPYLCFAECIVCSDYNSLNSSSRYSFVHIPKVRYGFFAFVRNAH